MTTATMNGTHESRVATSPTKTRKPKAADAMHVAIPALDIRTMRLTLIGDTPLLSHAWDEKAKRQMLDKQMKVPKQAKQAKDPEADVCNSLYWMSPKPKALRMIETKGARFGFPVIAFKSAAVDACSSADGITKVQARGAFHINGDLVLITDHKGKPAIPVMDEAMVRIAMGTADIRYRGRFDEWRVELEIRYNHNVLTPDQIANLFNIGGFSVGVGEHRPQCNGSRGMFRVG